MQAQSIPPAGSPDLPSRDEVGVKEGELVEGFGGAEDGGVDFEVFEDGGGFGAGAAGGVFEEFALAGEEVGGEAGGGGDVGEAEEVGGFGGGEGAGAFDGGDAAGDVHDFGVVAGPGVGKEEGDGGGGEAGAVGVAFAFGEEVEVEFEVGGEVGDAVAEGGGRRGVC